MTATDRCLDCSWPIAQHFKPSGEPRGCPIAGRTLAALSTQPRIGVRIGRNGDSRRRAAPGSDAELWHNRLGHKIVQFADCRDGDSMLFWDLETGDQWWSLLASMHSATRRATADEFAEVKAEVEYQLGYAVRVVRGV